MKTRAQLTCPAIIACALLMTSCGFTTRSKRTRDDRSALTNCKIQIPGTEAISIGGFPRNSNRVPSTGTVNVNIIMVDYPDSPATMTPSEAYAKISGATATFTEMSYGRLNYNMIPKLQWYRMSKSSTTYDSDRMPQIEEAVELADPDVDFSATDLVVVLSNPDTQTFKIGPAFPGVAGHGLTADGRDLHNFVSSGYDLNHWGSIWLNHESTHTLGMPDLYDMEGSYLPAPAGVLNPVSSLRHIGEYSYMGYNSFDSHSPGLLAWERWLLGWLDDDQVSCVNPYRDGDIEQKITPISETGGAKALVVPFGEFSALVVESRRAKGIDYKMTKTGALVYVINSKNETGHGPVQIYPGPVVGDPMMLNSIRAAGESVIVDNIKVDVVSSDDSGDVVKLSVTE